MIALHPPLTIARVEEPAPEDLATAADLAAARGNAMIAQAASADAQLNFESIDNSDAHLDELCEQLCWWVHTRKLWGVPRGPISLLGKLRTGTRALKANGGRDAACNTLLHALYTAYLSQPVDKDSLIFAAYYFDRLSNMKVIAADPRIAVTRQHCYVLLRGFRRRIHSMAVRIQTQEEAEGAAMKARVR